MVFLPLSSLLDLVLSSHSVPWTSSSILFISFSSLPCLREYRLARFSFILDDLNFNQNVFNESSLPKIHLRWIQFQNHLSQVNSKKSLRHLTIGCTLRTYCNNRDILTDLSTMRDIVSRIYFFIEQYPNKLKTSNDSNAETRRIKWFSIIRHYWNNLLCENVFICSFHAEVCAIF